MPLGYSKRGFARKAKYSNTIEALMPIDAIIIPSIIIPETDRCLSVLTVESNITENSVSVMLSTSSGSESPT
jgi:hypothetical protein